MSFNLSGNELAEPVAWNWQSKKNNAKKELK